MKTIVFPTEELLRSAAEQVLSVVERKKDAVIALGALEEELRLWRLVALLAKERAIPLGELRFFAACEFDGLVQGDRNSIESRLEDALFSASEAKRENLLLPRAAETEDYDEQIRRAGGIDLAVLGLGVNARVAFNEPATAFYTHTHVQRLTDRTKRELAPLFGGEEKVPPRGVTMGFCELCSARELIVIALGEEKSKAVFHMLYGRDDSVYPAAFLQLPPNVTVYADPPAASFLGEKGFDLVALYGK